MVGAAANLTGLRVLVVEDEALIAEELRERLEGLGMTVIAAVDSAEHAVRAAVDERPDLILMDVRLRGATDGIEAARRIAPLVNAPIVYLTAHSDPGTVQRARWTSPFGYILKPVREPDLVVGIEVAVQRHAIEQQLREQDQQHVETLTSIADGIVATDQNGHVTFMNPAAEALTRWSFAEAVGLKADEVFHVALDALGVAMTDPLRQALTGHQRTRLDFDNVFLISRDRSAIPIDGCTAPIADAQGTTVGAVAVFRDIRNRRRAEEAARRTSEELFHAQKTEAIGRLAGGLAHDFNNMLTVINGGTELVLQSTTLDDPTRALLLDVANAGARAAAVTRQFLSFARRQPLKPQLVDVNVVVTRLGTVFRHLLGDDVQLLEYVSADPVVAHVDQKHLEHALVSLVTNAREALPAGGVVTIGTTIVTLTDGDRAFGVEPGRYAMIAVADSGGGMDEKIQSRIFDPYFTTKGPELGAGLGLAAVQGFVEQSGGFLRLQTAPGSGACFKLYFPSPDSTIESQGRDEPT